MPDTHQTAPAGTPTLAVIPGDGIGPEVTAEALKVLEVAVPADVKVEQTRYDLGAERYLATGEVLPESVLAEIHRHDDCRPAEGIEWPHVASIQPHDADRRRFMRVR